MAKAPSAEAARFLMPMGTGDGLTFLLLSSRPADLRGGQIYFRVDHFCAEGASVLMECAQL